MRRSDQISAFYKILHDLECRLGGKRRLKDCTGRLRWPKRGVYFFFEPGENRLGVSELRVVRVGTHALKPNSKSTLWGRLRQHRGNQDFGGNHRGSIFRHHVGTAIIKREKLKTQYPNWEEKRSATSEIRDQEAPMEKKVSNYIGKLPFLWLSVEDPTGPKSQRGYLERNSIALLSNFGRLKSSTAIDPPSKGWLGSVCSNEKVESSGLWNDKHVQVKKVDPDFLDRLKKKTGRL